MCSSMYINSVRHHEQYHSFMSCRKLPGCHTSLTFATGKQGPRQTYLGALTTRFRIYFAAMGEHIQGLTVFAWALQRAVEAALQGGPSLLLH